MRAALCDALSAEDDDGLLSWPLKEVVDDVVMVPVEGEPATTSPVVERLPEHQVALELVERILGIN